MKKLPIGYSTFKDVIEENCLYVDKTNFAFDLINSGRYYFLSRPRRFGKTLFLDTLRTVFEGIKELFKGLYIYDKYDWSKTFPVLHISFGGGISRSIAELHDDIMRTLKRNQKDLKVTVDDISSTRGYFQDLIIKAYEAYNQKVVILIDEYDKPILDNIENKELATQIRDELKSFYSIIKDSDRYLKFVFITGVSKFSKVSLFSGLNNLNDITLNPNYATICGYTQKDLETVFYEHLKGQDYEKIREWYNGYKWLGEAVYNPFDILLFISNSYQYRNYWFSTGTPAFLLKLIEKNRYYLPNLEYVIKDEQILDSFDVDNIELETLMWQTGYLTIDKAIETPRGMKYQLKIPNKEVELSLIGTIADFLSRVDKAEIYKDSIYESLAQANFAELEKQLKSLFASIPYNNFTGAKLYEYEGYYASVFYAYVKSLGVELIGEDVTNKGRIDLTLKMPNAIFIFEFKTDEEGSIQQIKDKKYHEKYIGLNKQIYLVGIEFSSSERNILKVEWESVDASTMSL
jgi:hypothetical protein